MKAILRPRWAGYGFIHVKTPDYDRSVRQLEGRYSIFLSLSRIGEFYFIAIVERHSPGLRQKASAP